MSDETSKHFENFTEKQLLPKLLRHYHVGIPEILMSALLSVIMIFIETSEHISMEIHVRGDNSMCLLSKMHVHRLSEIPQRNLEIKG